MNSRIILENITKTKVVPVTTATILDITAGGITVKTQTGQVKFLAVNVGSRFVLGDTITMYNDSILGKSATVQPTRTVVV